MLFSDITIIDENLDVKENQYVGIQGDYITYISKEKPKDDFGRVYNGKNKLLMTGFFNTHAHSPMTLLRGYGENMVLQDWLEKRVFPFEDQLTPDDIYWGTLLAMAESIRFGIVSTTDMYYELPSMVKAILESGTKNNISRSIVSPEAQDLWKLESSREMKDSFSTFHHAGGDRVRVDMSLHAEYTSNPQIVRQLADYTREIGTNMHVHLSETEREHEDCKKRHGKTPTAYFNDLGLFDVPTTAAHCVWLENEDYQILKQKGVSVASNPVSNVKLASGVCNVPKLLDQGINVAIGTDGAASNNNLNFIEEIKYFATTAKVHYKDPTAVTPTEAIYAATIAGAKSQGRSDCGRLAMGNKADLIIIDLSGPNMHPIHKMKNNLVYSASGSDVVLTMADGNILYEDGEYRTIDLERIIYECDKAVNRIIKAL